MTRISDRRTFAIISHPDAGKTTLTEKLLATSGAINQAGAVRGRANTRATRSDWMEIEQQRGISISIQSERVARVLARPRTAPAWLMAPEVASNFSVSVVLPASGCEMIAKVRRD